MRPDPAGLLPAGITFREARESDYPLLKRLYRSSREPELARTGWSEEQKEAFALSQFALQDSWYRQNFHGMQMLVIEREAAPIGRLYLHEEDKLLNLMEITLEPAERGRGIGTAIVQWLQLDARERGVAMVLYVEEYNPARRLYARLGFLEEELEGVYMRMRWRPPTGG
jgi:GNAT superfamily N-acetyltransferase